MLVLLSLVFASVVSHQVFSIPSITSMPTMKGMTVNAWSAEAYNTSDYDQSITNLSNIRANWVLFTIFWFMESPTSADIHPRYDLYSASNSSLIHAIQKAHELGMKVALKPMVDVIGGTWRGQINPSNWTTWFTNYRHFIQDFAELAEANGVELYVVGTELKSSQQYQSSWRQVISETRTVFSKNLTYAANWDSYSTTQVRFWDALDFVGVDAYFPLTNSFNPSVSQLKNGWSNSPPGWWGAGRNWTNELYSTHTATGKQIVFTEIGYVSKNGTNMYPWDWNVSTTLDLQEQADCYQAALDVFKDKSWFSGWFWWNWETDPDAGGPSEMHYTPQNKPAETVLYQYYTEVRDLAVTGVQVSKTVVGYGLSVAINLTVENQGVFNEAFNLTVYANSTVIKTERVTLQNGVSRLIAYSWNTSGFVKGKYTISAYAWILQGESDIADNTYVGGNATVAMVGDVTGLVPSVPDGKVDVRDLAFVAKYYGKSVPPAPVNCDIVDDRRVDIKDLALMAKNYGKTDP